MSVKVKAAPGEPMAWLLAHYNDPQDGPCVLWPFAVSHGYGSIAKRNAHAVALEMRVGPPPKPGMEACHLPRICHNRLCIIHTYWGTRQQNRLDMIEDGTHFSVRRKTADHVDDHRVREIHAAYASGSESQRQIATRFGVTRSYVCMIVTGRARPHLGLGACIR